MIDHDCLFKELLTTFFWEFIQPKLLKLNQKPQKPGMGLEDVLKA